MNLILRSILLVAMLATAACDSESEAVLEEGQMTLKVPTVIREIASFNALPLEVQISINGELVRVVPVAGSGQVTPSTGEEAPDEFVATTTVNVPADQNNELGIAWFALTEGQKVLLADFSTLVLAGVTEFSTFIPATNNPEDNLFRYETTGARFDADGDGRTNLDEARDKRNLLSEYDLEVPFRSSFGGIQGQVRGGGIDNDLSGDVVELDDATTFRLRHDGTDLVLYVCGKDKTLHGDFPLTSTDPDSSNAYWHDDTVFVFIDGADSNSEGFYDGVDDFQLAFVRKTEEMIVSKGSGNQFCPSDPVDRNSNCVTHFFSPVVNTLCTYELTVRMPLAELNMTVGAPIGFDVEISDDDNGGRRDDSSAWIGFDDASNIDPRTFGTIILK